MDEIRRSTGLILSRTDGRSLMHCTARALVLFIPVENSPNRILHGISLHDSLSCLTVSYHARKWTGKIREHSRCYACHIFTQSSSNAFIGLLTVSMQQMSCFKLLPLPRSVILLGIIRSPVPGRAFKVGVAVVVVTQACVGRLKRCWVDTDRAVKLVDNGSHSLTSADNDTRRFWLNEPAAG